MRKVTARLGAAGMVAACLAALPLAAPALAAPALTAPALATPAPAPAPASAATAGFSVSGNRLLLNGADFMAQGLSLVAIAAPSSCADPTVKAAFAHLNATEMNAYKTKWHVNLVRFQVSQTVLSTGTSSQIAAYITEIKNAVTLAQSKPFDFGVILSMQDEKPGCGTAEPLPSADTVKAWSNLAPVFASDPDVMYELFNEPQNTTTTAAWDQWKSGGCAPITCPSGQTWVGHQDLVADIRKHASNLILADGALYARSFTGVPLLQDVSPGKGIVYAVHPYGVHSPATEQPLYGYLTPKVPVLVTEWNYGNCSDNPAAEMTWWKQQHIGLTGWSGDVLGSMINTWAYDPTSCTTGTQFVGGTALRTDFGA